VLSSDQSLNSTNIVPRLFGKASMQNYLQFLHLESQGCFVRSDNLQKGLLHQDCFGETANSRLIGDAVLGKTKVIIFVEI
jgi:hypothetical protein